MKEAYLFNILNIKLKCDKATFNFSSDRVVKKCFSRKQRKIEFYLGKFYVCQLQRKVVCKLQWKVLYSFYVLTFMVSFTYFLFFKFSVMIFVFLWWLKMCWVTSVLCYKEIILYEIDMLHGLEVTCRKRMCPFCPMIYA